MQSTSEVTRRQLFIEMDGEKLPKSPEQLENTGIDADLLRQLLIKFAFSVPTFTTESASKTLCIPMNISEELLWGLKEDQFLQVLGQQGPFNYSYKATQRGLEFAQRCREISGYVGPAPVSLEDYTAAIVEQHAARPQINFDQVRAAVDALVLPDDVLEVAALATTSGRSLFVFGPAGNGKTTLGRLLHNVKPSEIWIPYCISVGNSVIRLYDFEVHQQCPVNNELRYDKRWVKIHRPFIVAGGEMTIESLDLVFSPSLRFYEAPPHVKANGGTFLIDDFGRQRMEPHELLNRWIIPLESRRDHLTLVTGQKLQIPFLLNLIVATNLSVQHVADPAFLRRMGYRLLLEPPTESNYARIFQKYAAAHEIALQEGIMERVLAKYRAEGRELRGSEPRDLLERTRDICQLEGIPLRLDEHVLEVAWRGYFGGIGP